MARSDPVQSVVRGLQILELAGAAPEGVVLRDLATSLGISPAAAHNLARTLCLRRYLHKQASPPRYRLGPALLELAELHGNRAFRDRAATAVQSLAARFPKATVVFAEAMGGEILTRIRMSPERPGVVQRPAGMRMNPYTSASSLVYLAFWGAEERLEFQGRYPFQEFAPPELRTAKKLETALAAIRKVGYVALAPDARSTLVRIAVPVFDEGEHFRASLGLSYAAAGPGSPARMKRLGEEMLTVAKNFAVSAVLRKD